MSKAISREEAEKYAADDPVLRHMIDRGSPLTRETYIHTNWMDFPEEWTAEHEMQVPSASATTTRRPPCRCTNTTERRVAGRDFYLVWSNEHGGWRGPGDSYVQDVEHASRYLRNAVVASCVAALYGGTRERLGMLPELPVAEADAVRLEEIARVAKEWRAWLDEALDDMLGPVAPSDR